MNVYVETNFVLELTLLQEQHQSCEDILNLSQATTVQPVIPAYCLVEPYETLIRRHKDRKELWAQLDRELKQLERTSSYTQQINRIRDVVDILIYSADEEMNRLKDTQARLLKAAEIIPLTSEILESAAQHQSSHDLSPQDAIVYASVLEHLSQSSPASSCFLNKNLRF